MGSEWIMELVENLYLETAVFKVDVPIRDKKSIDKLVEDKDSLTKNDDDLGDSNNNVSSIDAEFIEVQYGSEKELFTGLSEAYKPLDTKELWYSQDGEKADNDSLEDDYWSFTASKDTESEMISTEEAEEKYMDAQYAAIAGAYSNISLKDKSKMDWFIKFNKHLFHSFELLYAVTRDVSYGQ